MFVSCDYIKNGVSKGGGSISDGGRGAFTVLLPDKQSIVNQPEIGGAQGGGYGA